MLYVVAWPVLGEADDTALRRLRAQYHPREADLIGPHFTLVFGAAAEREAALRTALASVDAAAVLVHDRAHRAVRSLPLCRAVRWRGRTDRHCTRRSIRCRRHEPFEPHITLGLFQRAAEAEQVARIVGRQHLPMTGRVEELALLRRDGDTLDDLWQASASAHEDAAAHRAGGPGRPSCCCSSSAAR